MTVTVAPPARGGYPVCRRQPGNRGVLGVAPAAEILPIRVVGPDLTNQEAVVLANQGIAQATADQADVICYAGPTTSRDQFAETIAAAQAADVVVVAGTGNLTGGAGDWFPAANPAVLAVGSDGDLSAPPRTTCSPPHRSEGTRKWTAPTWRRPWWPVRRRWCGPRTPI